MIKQFNDLEQRNLDYLQERSVRFEIVCLTANILKHSIFDAKMNIRSFLKEKGVHDFDNQPYGHKGKCKVKTHVLTFCREFLTETSIYRAGTRGDCRMWFGSAIFPITEANDLYVITSIGQELYIVNISKVDIESCCHTSFPSPVQKWIREVGYKNENQNHNHNNKKPY